ncbi:MAG: VWA domain-containing protein [Gemmataceae bacterium]|nr:VWA domain-containing protein [Gemmataceae bacterium]
MRVRHKPPNFVSMWMLDVFCCALGCVTLLWLLNTRQAGDQTAAARSALTDLTQARADLKVALTTLDSTKLRLTSEVQELTTQLAAVRTEQDDTARRLGIARDEAKSAQAQLDATKTALNAAEARVDATAKELALAREKTEDADEVLRKKSKEADALAKKAAAAAVTTAELQRLVRRKDDELAAARTTAADLQAQLDDLDARLAASEKDTAAASKAAKAASARAADELAAAKAAGEKSATDLSAVQGLVKDLKAKLDESRATIVDLQGQKAKLADKVDRMDKEVESRFAGITVTGKSVVFLVDMSGSMYKLDSGTAAPGKWPVVCETVAKVMRTIPNLERYQVVVFSRQARWLFGAGEWQRYEGEKSAAATKDALLAVKPEGDTNLYSAFDLAFGLRPKGLDTVYLFSDGLPTSGPGLTPAQEQSLDEQKRGELLAKHLREKLRAGWNRAGGGDRVKVHAIGFFYESPDVGAFLWALARENDGSFVGMSRP